MGSIFRSERMTLCQIFLPPESAYRIVADLGEIGCVQFRDLNDDITAFQRKFVTEVRRCEEMDRQMRYIQRELEKDGFKLRDIFDDLPPAPNPRDVVEVEAQLDKIECEVQELAQNEVNLRSNFLELTELSKVIEKAQGFFTEQEVINMDENTNIGGFTGESRGRLGFIAGALNRERAYAFERMLWRISRGNILLKRADIEEPLKDPRTGSTLYKTAFVVFYQGEQVSARIKKICTGFHASLYSCPNAHADRVDMHKSVLTRLEDLKVVLKQTEDHRNCVLGGVVKHLPTWHIMITKMKAVYHTLNSFNLDVTNKCLIGEAWIPTFDLEKVQQTLADGSAAMGSPTRSFLHILETKKHPPTFYRTNKFTRGFQNLIDAYGVANYREVNPALYTCITFPFLFAVMFGDLGHGFLLFLLGLWMVVDEKRLLRHKGGEIWRIMFGGRYIIMLLGLFAMYCGFMYNDTFSKSVNVFGSTWRVRYNTTTVLTNQNLQLDPSISTVGVYPIGMDPIWQLASNKIIFYNSYKMKLSIIFGVLHMTFGVCFSVENFVYFKKYALIILEFVPQVLFLLLLFGYMSFMMFYKWVLYSPRSDYQPDTPGCSSNVLIYFINMVLFKPSPVLKGCKMYMFDCQPTLEHAFVIVALICIPWILLGKPLYVQCVRSMEAKKRKKNEEFIETIEVQKGEVTIEATVIDPVPHAHDDDDEEEEEEPMSEIWIHQGIHTIEYCLSTISHTASYLRLWALSLAHAELSYVLWIMVMTMGLHFKGYAGAIGLYFIFWAWALLTIAIMIMMEGLSAFLHTLRLHWVEFMSKFYTGAGHAFMPFSFSAILSAEDDD